MFTQTDNNSHLTTLLKKRETNLDLTHQPVDESVNHKKSALKNIITGGLLFRETYDFDQPIKLIHILLFKIFESQGTHFQIFQISKKKGIIQTSLLVNSA